jgi:hypothetical protein
MALAPSVNLAGAFEAVVGALKVGGGALEGGRLEDGATPITVAAQIKCPDNDRNQ